MNHRSPTDIREYYRRVTEIDIGEIAEELLADRITGRTGQTLLCDCPNHASQTHTSLHIMLDKQGWYCFGCTRGGDVLHLVEFIQSGQVTSGQSGPMPETHRQARDFLAAKVGLPPLAGLGQPESVEEFEQKHQQAVRIRQVLTATSEYYHRQLMEKPRVLHWFQKYGIGEEMVRKLKIGYSAYKKWTDSKGVTQPSLLEFLKSCPEEFTDEEIQAAGVIYSPYGTAWCGFFNQRIIFPYWSRGQVVYMIGRQTPWTPKNEWEKPKYKKLWCRSEKNPHIAECIRNNVLYNEDILLSRPERLIITEGVTDCISLMEKGFPVVSPVTIQIKAEDWDRHLPKLKGVKSLYICQDNEISQAGMNGALRIGRVAEANGITVRIAILPLGEKQEQARRELRERFGIEASVGPKKLAEHMNGRSPEECKAADTLLADAKIDVNEFFAAGASAEDFERILAAAQTPLELAISKLSAETTAADLDPILAELAEIAQLKPIEEDRYLKMVQQRVGKGRVSLKNLRRQMKVTPIDGGKSSRKDRNDTNSGGPALAVASDNREAHWSDDLILNKNGTVKAILANVSLALRKAPEWAGAFAFNKFSNSTYLMRPAPWMTAAMIEPMEWTDQFDLKATEWLQQQGFYISNEITAKAVEVVAHEAEFHPVRDYLTSIEWDGKERLSTWLTVYLGVEATTYTEAVGSRWMISAVARIFDPGCKADCCLILEGEQGIKKSTALRKLAGDFFTDEIADLGSKDAAMQTRGVWIIEISELDSMNRSGVGKVKAFMSRSADRFRPPYGHRVILSPRQCIFAGSVNHNTYLNDETGGRRFWPIQCGQIDIEALAKDRDQLWAEAYSKYQADTPWWLDSPELNRLAREQQAERYEEDAWDELIMKFAEGKESVSIAEILDGLGKSPDHWNQQDRNRVGRWLRVHGWVKYNGGSNRARQRRYRRPD